MASFNPATDLPVEIEGVTQGYYEVKEIDPVARTITLEASYEEFHSAFYDWVWANHVYGENRAMSIIQFDYAQWELRGGEPRQYETSRMNYFEVFPLRYTQQDLGNIERVRTTIVLSYGWAEEG